MDADDSEGLADAAVSRILLDATRSLLWVESPADAREVATEAVVRLGGRVVEASTDPPDGIPADLSFGDGPPVLACAPPETDVRRLLEHHLPALVLDGRRAVELGSRADRLAEEASIDSLTRLSNRRVLGRALGRLRPGDVVIMIDLDHFKRVNDSLGHDAGDRVLSAFGLALLANVRAGDPAGRYGGEEFVVVLRETSDADAFLRRFRRSWEAARPLELTFTAGVARVRRDGRLALRAADRAMYRAKALGRDRHVWAVDADFDEDAPSAPLTDLTVPAPEFVAVSHLEVADGGQPDLEAAFRHRLGEVETWQGFKRLEVWADVADRTAYSMVSWWDSAETFRSYLRSDAHRRSHERIPTGDRRPRPRGLRRFRVIAR